MPKPRTVSKVFRPITIVSTVAMNSSYPHVCHDEDCPRNEPPRLTGHYDHAHQRQIQKRKQRIGYAPVQPVRDQRPTTKFAPRPLSSMNATAPNARSTTTDNGESHTAHLTLLWPASAMGVALGPWVSPILRICCEAPSLAPASSAASPC